MEQPVDVESQRARAASFGSVVDAYAAHRPDYPDEAVTWLVGETPATVLELGAGTGKLTASLCRLGHRVIATDPDPAMLAHLAATLPEATTVQARAEDIPLPASSVDVVVAGQAYHWFDHDHALPEIARVLRPGGALAVTWNMGDVRVPWVRKVFRLVDIASEESADDPFAGSDVFVLTDSRSVKHWQVYRRDTLVGFVASTSTAATLDESDRAALLTEAGALYDSYERGPDGLLMPWFTHCYRARVAGLDGPGELPMSLLGPEDETVVISFN